MNLLIRVLTVVAVLGECSLSGRVFSQEQQNTPSKNVKSPSNAIAPAKQMEIAIEPRIIDLATLLPAMLAKPVTVEFSDNSIREIAAWIQKEQKIQVLLDLKSLTDDVTVSTEQISERLDNAPLYLLLDRLQTRGLGWFLEGNNLRITTTAVAADKFSTIPYNVGDLFDAGYKSDALIATITGTTSGAWGVANANSSSGIVVLGDVLFVRQADRIHLEVAGLLAALRKHGRQTLILDCPQNLELRDALNRSITVKLRDTPLFAALQTIGTQAGIDIRLDLAALKNLGVRDRSPVSVELADQPLETVLRAFLTDFNLTWIIRDGVLWVTAQPQADNFRRTAVYNVMDLCVNDAEAAALAGAILGQTRGPWRGKSEDGNASKVGGVVHFARPGVMAVRQTERGLSEVSLLLENYRTALRASKPRKVDGIDPQEVITRYYRVASVIADELMLLLPLTVSPETWKSEENKGGIGTIQKRKGVPSVVIADTQNQEDEGQSGPNPSLVLDHSILIITQTRKAHRSITDLIEKFERGDDRSEPLLEEEGGSIGFGGGQQGGFGSGFFSIPESK